ncbi:Uma2 family endonuclease [Clostridium sp.]|uniref:Uma2 family endonuclease n=1 Tax=Clostridium sp. TaxID=1506 RepID=UPI0034560967
MILIIPYPRSFRTVCRGFYPDVAVYCDKNQIFYRGYIGIPQLVVEVLSPSNADDDLIVKKDLYEKYGVPEYWIISPMSKKVWIYYLQ